MKLYEVISFKRELLRRLSSVGSRLDDCKYIDLYEDYRKLREGGGKMTYIAVSYTHLAAPTEKNRHSPTY